MSQFWKMDEHCLYTILENPSMYCLLYSILSIQTVPVDAQPLKLEEQA